MARRLIGIGNPDRGDDAAGWEVAGAVSTWIVNRFTDGWQGRTIPVDGRGVTPTTGWCLEAHDLSASKLVAFREKDRRFVRTLIVEKLIDTGKLLDRLALLPVEENARVRLTEWVQATAKS